MSNNLKRKVVVITGNGGGMELESSKMLGARGAKVSMSDLQEKTLFDAAKEIRKAGGDVMATVGNVRNEQQVDDWISKTVEKPGKLDGAANLASVLLKTFHTASLENQQTKDRDFVIGVNLTGLMYCMRAELKHMNEKGSLVTCCQCHRTYGI